MHEASLAQGLIQTAARAVQDYNARQSGPRAGRITRLTCQLGLLSCVEAETLRACFDICAEGTPAHGAELVLTTAPLPCRCTGCGASFALFRRHFACPFCGCRQLRFQGGHGLTLTDLQVEAEENHD